MSDQVIKIIGARENNLKNISLELPKNKLIVMTGVSGSGKSSLAFDTLYQEGQRRYIESLSSYARQFLGSFEKPDVDRIDGLSPSISIDQKTTSHNPRSTVGTVTEIYDYLRLLYARIGVPYSYITGLPLIKQSIDEMVLKLMEYENGTTLLISSPLYVRQKGTFKKEIANLIKNGYFRAEVDKKQVLLEEIDELDKNKFHDISVIVDRITKDDDSKERIFSSVELASKLSDGRVDVKVNDILVSFSETYQEVDKGISLPDLEPRLFSFNTPIGACPYCNGLGVKYEVTEKLVVDMDKEPLNGGLKPYKNNFEENLSNQEIEIVAAKYGIDLSLKMKDLSERARHILLYGSEDKIHFKLRSAGGHYHEKESKFEGLIPTLTRRYLDTSSTWIREWIENFMEESICPSCEGKRLNKAALCVKINKLDIIELSSLSIENTLQFISSLNLDENDTKISNLVLNEIVSRLSFLKNVGLEYLTLSRNASTLSGGEAQRIRLATQIGSKLSGVLYVLDEPSIGLHQKDNQKLIKVLQEMRDLGNTLIIVEHDHETMLASDFLVDIGPGPGIHGGEVVAIGTPSQVMSNPNSITGLYLSNKLKIEISEKRRKPNDNNFILIKNANKNNLKNLTLKIPLQVLTLVTGVSGSGKSTLVNEIVVKNLWEKYYSRKKVTYDNSVVDDFNKLSKIIVIDQDPIGRSPRSNPATYTGVFDEIRDVFALTKESKARGYLKGRFSFNVKGGRCEACQGDGVKRISMHFLPDVYVPCEVCHGTRYNSDTLEILFKGKNIAEVLDMTIEDALHFFDSFSSIKNKISTLNEVGLGYLKLGQPATTLSGGEAQRVKLASELYKNITKETLYVLDEPTTGLHTDDVKKLIKVLNKIVDNGGTMIVIEHNLDVIKNADYVIDLGPLGGDKGGEIVGVGTPEEISKIPNSFTGQFLKDILK